ncbi:MAG TPA: TlpA disulfide reductase family protein [Verrucomicrobiae bacterium]|nr:TlpA disulfide reductase family protein [Verrucomicrobiae bacterium]
MSSKFQKLSATACVVAVLTLIGCGKGMQNQGTKETSSAAPETSLQIPTMEGTSASIEQYKGKVVLVNFWATWCAPCRTEIPWLIEFNEKYGPKGLVILGIAMDDEGNKVVQPYVRDRRFDVNGHPEAMNYQILLGNSKIAEKFGGILGMPTSMLYSRDGRKIKTIVGLIDHDDLSKTLDGKL